MEPNNNMQNGNVSEPRPVRAPGFANGSANGGDAADVVAPVNGGNDVVFQDKPKKNHGMLYGMILLAILAAGGIGFGVWAMMDGNSRAQKKDEQISQLQSQLAEKSEVVVEDDTTVVDDDEGGDSTTNTSVANTTDYIYVGEWGLKIKIPDSLSTVSYRFSHEAGFTKVTVWGVDCSGGRCQFFPNYANVNENAYGMGSITRYPKGTTFNEASSPTLVFSDESYDYYQYHPQMIYTTDNPSDEAQWEMDGINIINDMLSNPDNYSKF